MNLFNTEAYTLSEVKESLSEDYNLAFAPLLEKHHDFLEESISVILAKETGPNVKQAHLGRFLHLLAMHAKAEEETLYIGLKSASDKLARIEGTAAQDEHDLAMQLSDELKDMGFDSNWSEEIEAKAQVIAGWVQNHIKEEEHEIFKTAKKDIAEEEMESFRDDYLEKCKTYLEEEMESPIQVKPMSADRMSNLY